MRENSQALPVEVLMTDDRPYITKEIQEKIASGELTYFTVAVEPARAEFLKRALYFPLCIHCKREEAECIAHPCLRTLYDTHGYVAAKGNFCPQCGSTDFEGHFIETGAGDDGGEAHQKIYCNNCPAQWYDIYTLTGYKMIKENDMK
jgi:hypothetical protein